MARQFRCQDESFGRCGRPATVKIVVRRRSAPWTEHESRWCAEHAAALKVPRGWQVVKRQPVVQAAA
jgi:hypothetical protein